MTPKALPFCSVIVPTRNRPDSLAECVAALSRLDYPSDRFEVIVVDDGSATPLSGLVDEARGQVSITLVRQESSGPGVARNTGARTAREGVARLHRRRLPTRPSVAAADRRRVHR